MLILTCFTCVWGTPPFAFAQGKAAPPPPPPPAPLHYSVPSPFDQAKVVVDSNGNPIPEKKQSAADCFLPPLNGLQPDTVAVTDLQVPAKSRHEFEAACADLHDKKVADAESHLRKALKQDDKFPAAWVLLGQMLEAEQKGDQARDACTKPASMSYLPAYLCLADISARSGNWDDVLKMSGQALQIDPATDAPAYSYIAVANFRLHHLPEAEKNALRAIEIDKGNKDPRVHFLLAQIYEAEGNTSSEAAQLREYLKFATDPSDAAMVRNYLAALGK